MAFQTVPLSLAHPQDVAWNRALGCFVLANARTLELYSPDWERLPGEFPFTRGFTDSPLVIAVGDSLVVGSSWDGGLYVLDAATLTVRRNYRLGLYINGLAPVSEDTFLVQYATPEHEHRHALYGLDLAPRLELVLSPLAFAATVATGPGTLEGCMAAGKGVYLAFRYSLEQRRMTTLRRLPLLGVHPFSYAACPGGSVAGNGTHFILLDRALDTAGILDLTHRPMTGVSMLRTVSHQGRRTLFAIDYVGHTLHCWGLGQA